MLKAILKGKAGRVNAEGAEEQSWRDIFQKREDLLTAVFFSRLRYLTEEGEQNVLRMLVGDESAKKLGSVNEVVFWPKLSGLEARKYVEPDVLLLFDNSLLLIEVKPPFGGDQHEDQWLAQVKSLARQRDNDEAEIAVPDEFHFLALGRNTLDSQKAAENLKNSCFIDGLESVHRLEWDDVCRGIQKLSDAEQGRDRVVYADWIDAFSLFGLIAPPLPFEDMLKLKHCSIVHWQVSMNSFGVPANKSTLPSVCWCGLTKISKSMRLEVFQWK